jgi:hypothetical protein
MQVAEHQNEPRESCASVEGARAVETGMRGARAEEKGGRGRRRAGLTIHTYLIPHTGWVEEIFDLGVRRTG